MCFHNYCQKQRKVQLVLSNLNHAYIVACILCVKTTRHINFWKVLEETDQKKILKFIRFFPRFKAKLKESVVPETATIDEAEI
eukprot:UN03219